MSNDATGTRYAALAGVFVLLVGGVGAAVLLGVVPGGGGGGGGMSLDAVPNGSDVVVHADGVIVDDPTTERIANHAIDRFSTDESGPSSYEELPANATADAEFGVDDFDHATVYGRIPDAGLAVASEDAYLGAVVSTDVGEETFVSALSNSSSEADAEYTVTEGSYAGHTLYVYDETDAADVGAVESDDPLYVGVLDGNRYAMGTERAVKASIGAVEGEGSSPGGLLRERVTEEDGHVVLAADLRGEAATQSVTDSVGVVPAEVVSFAYYTEGDDTIGAPLTARMNGSDDATTAGERIDGLLGVAGMGVENESVRAQLDDVNVTTDGATMSVRYESSVAEVNAVVDYLYGSRYARPSGTV